MNCRAGFQNFLCAWLVILMPYLDAEHAPEKDAVADSCRPVELTALTKMLMENSLRSFETANGNDVGTWPPGFPELQVDRNSSLQVSKVQCSLLFMAQGLEKILQDQRNNLNPKDTPLHKMLKETMYRVNTLAACVKEVHGGECSPMPSPPNMPRHAFERKQWSHTLMKTAIVYLDWLEGKIGGQFSTIREGNKIKRITMATITRKMKMKHKHTKATHQNYFEGSGHLL